MKCKNCGCEMNENDLFCAECGAKNESNDVEVKVETQEQNRSNGNMRKIIAIVIIVGIIAVVIAAIVSANAKTYNFESSELGEIIWSENYEKYEGDTLIVHGFFYEHPTEKGVYVLAKDLNDEKPVYFTADSIDEELGDGSEITITGFLNKMNESSSVTVVRAQEIEVIKKEEKNISYACVDDLIKDSSNAVNKRVTLSGIITCVSDEDAVIDDVGAPTDGHFVRLDRGTAVKDFRDLSFGLYNVTGILSLTSYGDLILTLDNVKLIEEQEVPLPVSSPEELYNNPITYDKKLIVVEGWIEGAGSDLYILASGNIKIELSGIKEEDRVGLTGGYSKITGIFHAYGGSNDCDLIEVEKVGN